MTLSGTQVFILYKLFNSIASKYFSLRWKYFILKSSLVFYLIPFAWFKFIVLREIYKIFPNLKTYFSSSIKHIDLTKYILVIQDDKIISWSVKVIWLILSLICIVSISKIELFYNIKAELKVKKDVKLVYSNLCDVPYTIYFLNIWLC